MWNILGILLILTHFYAMPWCQVFIPAFHLQTVTGGSIYFVKSCPLNFKSAFSSSFLRCMFIYLQN